MLALLACFARFDCLLALLALLASLCLLCLLALLACFARLLCLLCFALIACLLCLRCALCLLALLASFACFAGTPKISFRSPVSGVPKNRKKKSPPGTLSFLTKKRPRRQLSAFFFWIVGFVDFGTLGNPSKMRCKILKIPGFLRANLRNLPLFQPGAPRNPPRPLPLLFSFIMR